MVDLVFQNRTIGREPARTAMTAQYRFLADYSNIIGRFSVF
jgi:hypothetical protein